MVGVGTRTTVQELTRPRRVAHRGGAGLAPENTLAAFRLGLAHDADTVELDLHMSKDGALIVMHDADVSRATGATGAISALTLAELRTLNAATTYKGQDLAPQRIPTLQEVFELARGRASVQIEIKLRVDKTRYAGIEAKVLEVVQQYDMLADVAVISFDFPTLHTITALEPRVQTCALISAPYPFRFTAQQAATPVAAALAAQGFRCVGVQHHLLTPHLFQALRTQGLRVGVWTVNTPSSIRKFATMGVDFITSDRPDLLRALIP
jgi:glycerophosphoryl diester phosphodiesterase